MDKSEGNLLAETTVGELWYGDKNRNSDPAKLYKIPGEQHVYVDNYEVGDDSIFKLTEDGLLQDGLYRNRYPNGNTELGCILHKRGDRVESIVNKLYKFSPSGGIRYFEQVCSKEDKNKYKEIFII